MAMYKRDDGSETTLPKVEYLGVDWSDLVFNYQESVKKLTDEIIKSRGIPANVFRGAHHDKDKDV